MKIAGLAGASVGLAACRAPQEQGAAAVVVAEPAMNHTNADTGELDMDAAHEEGVKIFLDNIGKDELFWGNKLEYTMDGETKVFAISCRQVDWEVEPGKTIAAMTYNGTVPGPEIRVTEGMLGPFIIEPADPSQDPEFDSDYTLILNDSGVGFSLNDKSFPYTQPIMAKVGERVRIRYMNEGLMIHPMHLHGLEQLVFAKDGWNLPMPYMNDTVNIAPSERFDVIVKCHTPGAWAFHCHILSHAESAHGMFGMVTAVVVQE
jgi:FtsP/CotA-like multicopper oxidase with cupredoxin domain